MVDIIKDPNRVSQDIFSMLFGNEVRLVHIELAIRVGLPKAMLLSQIHYWLCRSKNIKDGKYWTYNTYEQWSEQFPFFSARSIKRWMAELEETGIVESQIMYKGTYNRTKWYTINYKNLEKTVQT